MRKLCIIAAGLLAVLAGRANAQPCVTTAQNCGPPSGYFLDLAVPNSDGSGNSTTVPTSYESYTADFTATLATTYLTFAFRDDAAFLSLADVTLEDITTASANFLLNGDFSGGPVGASAPTHWTYLEPPYDVTGGGANGGEVLSNCGPGNTGNCYNDGAIQGYDGITQSVTTNVGDVYQLSFELVNSGTQSTFSQLATNGQIHGPQGNGIDVVAYEGPIPNFSSVPEPATLFMVGSGLLGLAAARRRRRA